MSDLQLRAPTRECMKHVTDWRQSEDVRLGLRTGRILTELDQERFYEQVLSGHHSEHRYWLARDGDYPSAFTGLTDIDWEAGHAEISLLVNPGAKKGTGTAAVDLVLREAFERMRLRHVFGECYDHNPAMGFWEKMLERRGCKDNQVDIPGRKFWDGNLYGSALFWFTP